MLELWVGTFVVEFLLYWWLWPVRRYASVIIGLLIIVTTVGLVLWLEPFPSLCLIILSMCRLGNLGRIVKSRMHESYLRRAARRTSLWLFISHCLIFVVVVLPFTFAPRWTMNFLVVLQLGVAFTVLMITIRNIAKLKFNTPETFLTDKELPTVTVAIPARNETTDLEACLRTILANDYPKLEVIVLDDCSQNGRTADIIRSFAHDGVRFVKGQEPAEHWLAKNQAYQKLYQEASGDLILFCGVDVRFGLQAIRSMVNLMAFKNKSMLSVLPVRIRSSPASAFIQPMRYWWELSLPRRLFNRPAVLSTCWMIGREDLKRLGGFAAVSHNILPEGFFARELVKTDQYSFVRSSSELVVETVKSFQDQYATSIRTRYPQLRRRPENVLILSILSLIFLLGPFLGLVAVVWLKSTYLLPLLSCLLLIACHLVIVNSTDSANSLLAALTFPVAVIGQMWLDFSSMVRYEFGTVEWKDRNICIPVMHTVPHLPKLDAENPKSQ